MSAIIAPIILRGDPGLPWPKAFASASRAETECDRRDPNQHPAPARGANEPAAAISLLNPMETRNVGIPKVMHNSRLVARDDLARYAEAATDRLASRTANDPAKQLS